MYNKVQVVTFGSLFDMHNTTTIPTNIKLYHYYANRNQHLLLFPILLHWLNLRGVLLGIFGWIGGGNGHYYYLLHISNR